MTSTIIFLSLLFLFLSLMLVFKIRLVLDLNNNKIIIMIWLFSIKIITLNISIIGLYLEINDNKKLKPISLILTKEDKYLISQIKSSILDKLYYDDIIISSNIGLGNSHHTAIIVCILNMLCNKISQLTFLKNKDARLYFSNVPDFIGVKFLMDIEAKVYFTVFDLVFAIILSFYKRGRYVKEAK